LAQSYSKRDAYVIRISEMYLIMAEAALETGDAASAYQYLLELADNRAINGNGSEMLENYGVASASDVSIEFLLDERARELATEGLRFWDLKRTGKLVHAFRFIPQEQLDAIRNTDEFVQNPGYN
jgi:uncharacterized protein HemY